MIIDLIKWIEIYLFGAFDLQWSWSCTNCECVVQNSIAPVRAASNYLTSALIPVAKTAI